MCCRAMLGPFGLCLLATCLAFGVPRAAEEPTGASGYPAPPFDLPWLGIENARLPSADLFTTSPATLLVFWSLGCPRCEEAVRQLPEIQTIVDRAGGQIFAVAFGPDPGAVEEFLWTYAVDIPHLWDQGGRTATAWGLGIRHFRVFLVDRRGIIGHSQDETIFDDPDRLATLVRSLVDGDQVGRATVSPSPGEAPPRPADAERPLALRVEGTARLLDAENASPTSRGLYGETPENGALFLYRWDLRASWSPSSGIAVIPWLRLSNESESALTEGADRLSSKYGSLTVRAQRSWLTSELGAFRLQASRLLLQRWDADDAPPLGGVAGCGCGGGGTGLAWRSLEALEPPYTFEGIAVRTRLKVRLSGWFAVPRWEHHVPADAPGAERSTARYRQLLWGAEAAWGRGSGGSSSIPVDLALAWLRSEDDLRSLDAATDFLPPQRDGEGVGARFIVGRRSLSVDGEFAWWRQLLGKRETEDRGWIVGLSGERRWGAVRVDGRFHWIHTGADFDPTFRALTYDPNREGWRASAGTGWLDAEGLERIFGRVFVRLMQEVDEELFPGFGRMDATTASISLGGAPLQGLHLQIHGVRVEETHPRLSLPQARRTGISFDASWLGSPGVEPTLRIDRVKEDGPDRVYWAGYLSVRVFT